jgi:hypothetical protein
VTISRYAAVLDTYGIGLMAPWRGPADRFVEGP